MLSNRQITAFSLVAMLLGGCASTTSQPSAPSDPSATSVLTRTVYSDDGVSELSTPETWGSRPDFGQDAALRVAEENGQAYLLVNSYFPGDIDPTPLPKFAETYANNLAAGLSKGKVSGPKSLTINGMEAYRYLVTGDVGGGKLTYVTTVIGGEHVMHHLVGWVAAESYSGEQHILNRITGSFRESASPRSSKRRVALNFAWPEELQSVAAFHRKAVKRGESSEIKAQYLWTVRPGGTNELVVSTRVMNQKLIGAEGAKNDYLNNLLKQIGTEVPDYVVNSEGEFVRVDNLSAYQQRIEKAVISNLPADVSSRTEEILAMVRPNLSEQFLAAAVTDDWNKTVGGWVNSSYVVGENYQFKEVYYAPSLGEIPFDMKVSRQITGFAPCTGNESQCVKLLHTATVSGEDFRSAMARFLEGVVGQPVNVKQVSVVRKMEIVAEPDTLIPHRSRSTEETIVVIEDSKGKAQTSRDSKDTRITYSYKTQTASR